MFAQTIPKQIFIVKVNNTSSEDVLTRLIPSTGEPLPVIGLGTYRAFNVSRNAPQNNDLRKVLKLFFDAGGSVIDTSPMYGQAEAIVGDLLENLSLHEKTFIATKVWTNGMEKGIDEMNMSFQKLRCQNMELMQIHNLVDTDVHLETLKSWKSEGRIKYIGITHYSHSAFGELGSYIKTEPEIDFCQFPYSIERRSAETYFLKFCADYGVATLINCPFEQDGLFLGIHRKKLPEWAGHLGIESWAQYFLKYLLADQSVTCLIPATSNPSHMADNLKAGIGPLPDLAERTRMALYFENL